LWLECPHTRGRLKAQAVQRPSADSPPVAPCMWHDVMSHA
jgi:hypothetical protein